MIRIIIRWILEIVVYQLIFNQINKINFRLITNNFTTQLLTLSTVNILMFLRDLILDKITNNNFFRILEATYGLHVRLLFDRTSKKVFWVGFVFLLRIYRWFVLFKKLILWPFKLGIFSFIFSIFGVDMSWFLSLFNIFSFNIPNWVFFQYLNLYNNWLGWWKNYVNVKSLNNVSLASKENIKYESITSNEPEINNSIFNKKILLLVLA